MVAASGSDGFSLPVLVAAGVVAIGWLLVTAALWTARRPPDAAPAPATMELGPEPPAVAAVLCDDYEICAETAPATLLDLAARDVIALDEIQPGQTICRVPEAPPPDVAPFERLVLVALAGKAIRGVVPAAALTTGTDDASTKWHRELAQLVVADAQARGLTVNRWPKRTVAVIGAGVVAVVALLVVAAQLGGDAEDHPVVAGLAAGAAAGGAFVLATVAGRLQRSLAQLPTPAGAEAESRWLGVRAHLADNERLAELPPAAVRLYGRHLAYAAGFGLADHAVDALPFGAEDDRLAWSPHGGRWRRVRVRYPRLRPPAWGRHPAVAVALALAWAVFAILVLVQARGYDRAIFAADAVLLAPPLLWSIWVLARAVPDLFATCTVMGTVVRCRTRARASSSRDTPKYRYYVAVDDGTRDRITAYRVSQELYGGVRQGQDVTAEVTPRLGYVRRFSLLAERP